MSDLQVVILLMLLRYVVSTCNGLLIDRLIVVTN